MRSALRSETGVVLVVAIEVLAITLLLAAAAVGVAVSTNDLTNHDVNTKQAVQAADAGARVATFRLSEVEPLPNACPTEPTQATVGATGLCPMDGPETLGNGSSFEYWISRALQAGDTCAGVPVYNPANAVEQRCVTAVGTANHVSERIQERVAAYTSTPVFPTAIFGTKSVFIANNATIVSDTLGDPALLGTNGTLTINGGTTAIDGYALPPQATLQLANNVTENGPTTGISTPYPVPTSINPGTTATNTSAPYDTSTTFQGGTCAEPATWTGPAWVQTNCDYRILCPDKSSCDSSSGVTFNALTRTLTLANKATLVLGGGFYNFCSVSVGNNAVITIAPGAKVSFFIDSPSDHGDCSSTTSGTFTMSQGATFNAGGSALNAQVFVYGNPSSLGTNQVNLQNVGSSAFLLDAPFSTIDLAPSNNTVFKGSMMGYAVTIGQASNFTYEADSSTLASGSLESFYRSYWEQCAGLGTTSAPAAGC